MVRGIGDPVEILSGVTSDAEIARVPVGIDGEIRLPKRLLLR